MICELCEPTVCVNVVQCWLLTLETLYSGGFSSEYDAAGMLSSLSQTWAPTVGPEQFEVRHPLWEILTLFSPGTHWAEYMPGSLAAASLSTLNLTAVALQVPSAFRAPWVVSFLCRKQSCPFSYTHSSSGQSPGVKRFPV